MALKNLAGLAIPGFVVLLLLSGCGGGYGKLSVESNSDITVDTLLRESESYVMYSDGVFPNIPAAVIFDFRNDSRAINVGPRWQKVADRNKAETLVGLIRQEPGRGPNIPRLWRILGPDDYLYGYVYTWLTRLDMTMVDETTLLVENLT